MNRTGVIVILSAGLCGCAGPQPVRPPAVGSGPTLALMSDGLQLRRWIVGDDTATIAVAMLAYGDTDWLDPADRDRLSRNGLRLVRVPAAAIDSLQADLHTVMQDLDAWHGQVLEWRAIDRRELGDRPRAVYIDGRPQRFEGGRLEIALRGWTLPMEFGPRFYIELFPRHVVSVEAPPRIGGRPREDRAQPLPTIALTAMLEADYAYVLVAEGPQVDWNAFGGSADEVDDPATSPPASGAGPPDPAGPVAPTPQTVGQLLLTRSGERPLRELYVLVPRIPRERFPAGLEPAPPAMESGGG